jgi:hypothetical protein
MHSKPFSSFLAILFVSCCILTACSTVRLTPSAARYRKAGEKSEKAQAQADLIRAQLDSARFKAQRLEAALRQDVELAKEIATLLGNQVDDAALRSDPLQALQGPALARQDPKSLALAEDTLEPQGRAVVVNQVIDLWWTGLLDAKHDPLFQRIVGKSRPAPAASGEKPIQEPPPLLESQARIGYLERQLAQEDLAVRQLQAVENGDYEYFVDGSVYFSIEPMVAIRPGLEAVAIPSLAVNWRPFNMDSRFLWKGARLGGLSSMALQATFGGALNPSGSGDDSTTGALGVGLSFPIASFGAFSLGSVWFDQDGDSKGAPYISITLGDFGKSTTQGGS